MIPIGLDNVTFKFFRQEFQIFFVCGYRLRSNLIYRDVISSFHACENELISKSIQKREPFFFFLEHCQLNNIILTISRLSQERIRAWKWIWCSNASFLTTWFKSTFRAACWSSFRGYPSGWMPMPFRLASRSGSPLYLPWPPRRLVSTTHFHPSPTLRYAHQELWLPNRQRASRKQKQPLSSTHK